jgi:hypothetical protein
VGGKYDAYVEMRNVHTILLGHLKGGDPLRDLGVYGKIILKLDLEEFRCGDWKWIHLLRVG